MSLAEENQRLALWVARRYPGPDPDAVAGEALRGLVEAEAAHDPARGRFAVLAVILCKRRAFEEVSRQRRNASRETPLYRVTAEGEEVEREDLPHVVPHDGAGLMAARVREVLAGLHPREREILARRFGLDGPEETLEEIGRAVGLSRARVGQLERRALGKLRRALSRRSRP